MFAQPHFNSSPTNTSDFTSPISAGPHSSPSGLPAVQRTNSVEQVPMVNTVQASPTPFPPPPSTVRDRSSSRSRFNLSQIATRHLPFVPNTGTPDRFQQQTSYAPAQYASPQPQYSMVVPPAARRAASTGAISTAPAPLTTEQPVPSVTNTPEQIQHGFALPPPPPGPPPGGRSQSLNRIPDRQGQPGDEGHLVRGYPPSRTAALRSNPLGPIPPTPADWVEDSNRGQTHSNAPPERGISHQRQSPPRNEHGNEQRREANTSPPDQGTSQPPPARPRDPSVVRGIRERRSESRASREPSTSRERGVRPDSPQEARVPEVTPSNLVLQSSNSGALGRRRHVSKAKISPLLDGRTSPALPRQRKSSEVTVPSQPGSAAIPQSAGQGSLPATPPSTGHASSNTYRSPALRSHTLTEQPLASKDASRGELVNLTIDTQHVPKQRPVSHILHTPIDERAMPPPLVPSRPTSSKGLPPSQEKSGPTAFMREANARHTRFIEAESTAQSDEERLQLFAEFIVQESRLRRDLYSEAFEAMGGDVLDLTRDLWRSNKTAKRPKKSLASIDTMMDEPSAPRAPSQPPSSSSDVPTGGISATATSMSSASDTFTPISAPDSPISKNGQQLARAVNRNPFQPMLSPIQSMAMSTIIDDDESSRGRQASRWWETSTDANSVGGSRYWERSRREMKYMGLPREARENLQWESIPEDPGPSSYGHAYGPNEYPPEKTGWHDEPPSAEHGRHFTPEPQGMDMSRLITLPPSYPRHHPAVNNKHPDLAPLRNVLRSLNARDEVTRVREEYEAGSGGKLMQLEAPEDTATRRKMFRHSIQDSVTTGEMTFAEAAKAEADFDAVEAKRGRDQAQKAFDHFQEKMMSPLNTLFKDGVNKATMSMEQLHDSLSHEARSHNPNQTQEEGDEQPELLEKLTLIKWFHECREQLHKEMFNLEGESDERYKTLILLPYRQAGNEDKVKEVESFFDRDSQERRVKFEKKALSRFEELLRVTEQHVTRGAEIQLSAFWDIAPELLKTIQKVPTTLETFELMIPAQETEENPNYHEYPMQYLYTILAHSEKSAYQFIEAQVNLFCLLHEVKSAVMNASCRLMETQRVMEGDEAEEVEREMKEIQRSEDTSLTTDLKERVNLVEDQWRQALGKGLEECKQRIKVYLYDSGGWDESLDE
ncbi:MAG: hypothetical protein Q9162_004988 [Coniocarpon cinnabarinum]